jgi:ABC-2 type transport system ATP-binding protein
MTRKRKVTVNGSLVPFIELGVGFNPELTGRENVYLNGAMLGFSKSEIDAMYDEIVEFAELHEFMDQKLKNYSSGMQVRLAFSVAIKAQGDILVLDEVLAVGDEAFQRKCHAYFNRLKRSKSTVILVTHDMSAVDRFCNKAMLIDEGKIQIQGDPYKVAATYSRNNNSDYEMKKYEDKQSFVIKLYGDNGKEKNKFDHDENMTVDLLWEQDGVKNIGVAVFKDNGEFVFGPNTYRDKYSISGKKQASCTIKLNLNEGEYFLKAGIMGEDDKQIISFIEEGPHFFVGSDGSKWGGVTKLEYGWDSQTASANKSSRTN